MKRRIPPVHGRTNGVGFVPQSDKLSIVSHSRVHARRNIFLDSQEQVIYQFLATRIYKFIGWRAGGCHFDEVGLVNLGVSSGELSFSKSYMVD